MRWLRPIVALLCLLACPVPQIQALQEASPRACCRKGGHACCKRYQKTGKQLFQSSKNSDCTCRPPVFLKQSPCCLAPSLADAEAWEQVAQALPGSKLLRHAPAFAAQPRAPPSAFPAAS